MKKVGKKYVALLLVLILSLSVLSGCASNDSNEISKNDEFFRLGTASMGGNFFPIGSAIAQLANEKVEGVNASAQATGGSAENCNFLQQGELELGLVQSATLRDAYTGQGKFEGRKLENLRGVTSIYFMNFHVLVRKDAGIEKIEDLKGKKIAVGPLGGGIEVNTNKLLSAYGMTQDDYEAVYGTKGEAQEALKTGRADVHIYATGLGSSQVTELMLTGDIKLIPVDADKIDNIIKDYPEFGQSVIPAGTYKGQDTELSTIAGSALLTTTDKVSEEAIYNLTKAMYENLEYLVSYHKYFEQTKAESATLGMPVPLHPGAEKYYKEIGVLK